MSVPDALAAIPHRPPFLFLDEIVELTADRVLARKRVDPSADFFAGHYPGNPIMPGVLLCECAFQAGAVLMMNSEFKIQNPIDQMPVLTRVREAKFKHVVRPGQVLDIEVTLDEELDGAFFMTGRVSADGKLVVRVEFVCMMTAEG